MPIRTVHLSRAALKADVLSLPEGVTWLNLGAHMTPIGEFPHAPFDGSSNRPCPAELHLFVTNIPEPADLWCTRPDEHDLHVAHIAAGLPVVAWKDAE